MPRRTAGKLDAIDISRGKLSKLAVRLTERFRLTGLQVVQWREKMTENRQWLINGRPRGRGLVDDDFKKVVTAVPECAEGHVLVKNELLGFDPAQKGWMENIGGYVAPTEIGEVMRGSGIGTVVESRHPDFSVGDKVMGQLRGRGRCNRFDGRANCKDRRMSHNRHRWRRGKVQMADG